MGNEFTIREISAEEYELMLKKELEIKGLEQCVKERCDMIDEECAYLGYVGKAGVMESLDEILNLIRLDKREKWIPVTEKLPEEYGEYLITWTCDQQKKPLIAIAECENNGSDAFNIKWLFDEYMSAYTNIKVTAWRPLPEPFKAEGNM